jgi:ATP-dependent DNA helicase RecQ
MPDAAVQFPAGLDPYRARLRDVFGYPDFRDGQAEVLEALAESDVVGVMPTGSGKSACFVLPALEVGRTLVVSPLIALMRDQVANLGRANVEAAFINSSVGRAEKNARYLAFVRGELPLLYLAPEGLRNAKLIAGLRRHGVNLLAIDEAHCISQWGHDFRPDYLLLGALREQLGNPRVLALTATADARVRKDIAVRLGIDGAAHEVVTSFDRPNLDLSVEVHPNIGKRIDRMIAIVRGRPEGSGIVYVRTRQRSEELAEALREAGVAAEAYHAGLGSDMRSAVQGRFDRGETPVIVATNAFGMGVDKPDVRFVIHFNMPGRLESYYQEAGRAGRDGEPAACVLLYSKRDRQAQQWFIDEAHPDDARVRTIWRDLLYRDHDQPLDDDQTNNALEALRASGLVAPTELRLLSQDPDAPIDTRTISAHREYAESRLARMVEYAETSACRRRLILAYFGEEAPPTCGRCDNCQPPAPRRRRDRARRGAEPRPGADPTGPLHERLRTWRRERAQADGVAAFIIFGDRTLEDIVERRPNTAVGLLEVWGLGRAKVERYGAELLKLIRDAPPP